MDEALSDRRIPGGTWRRGCSQGAPTNVPAKCQGISKSFDIRAMRAVPSLDKGRVHSVDFQTLRALGCSVAK